MASAAPSLDEFLQKSFRCAFFFARLQWYKTFLIENGSIDAFDCSSQYQPMSGEAINANCLVMKVSFGQISLLHNIKEAPSNLGAAGNACSGKGIIEKLCQQKIQPVELI